ncbi:MurR/RpiR family transcriptional regulator [bacterium]|nr:MAG: MurR/RpiR family transcriptional regulator [bacterium]
MNDSMLRLRSKDDLIRLIAAEEGFSAAHRQIASYLIRDYRRACFMSASELAEAVGVSQATVTRFANQLGFGGYQSLVTAIQGIVRSELTGVDRVEGLRRGRAVPRALDRILDEELAQLRALRSSDQLASVERMARAIAAAGRVYVVGFRSAAGIATQFAFFLRKLHPDVVHLRDTSSEALELLALATPPGSLAVGFLYPRYPRETLELLAHAAEHAVKIAAVTDSVLSPAAKLAEVALIAPASSTGVFDSYCTFQVLASFLFTVLATHGAGADDYLRRFEGFARDAAIFTGQDPGPLHAARDRETP